MSLKARGNSVFAVDESLCMYKNDRKTDEKNFFSAENQTLPENKNIYIYKTVFLESVVQNISRLNNVFSLGRRRRHLLLFRS